MDPATLLRTFATVFPAELPDKTMVATVVLVTRYRRPLAVWAGAVAAFTLHVTVAVVAGRFVSLLPEVVVGLVVAAVFAVGAIVLLRAARAHRRQDPAATEPYTAPTTRSAMAGSFAVVALAEWGDLTQLATAGLAARSDAAPAVWVGALAALALVAAIAATVGGQVLSRVPIHRVSYAAALVFAGLAVWTLVDLLSAV